MHWTPDSDRNVIPTSSARSNISGLPIEPEIFSLTDSYSGVEPA